MSDLATFAAGQQAILRALAAQGEMLAIIVEAVTKEAGPSELADALTRLALAVERVEAKLDAQTPIRPTNRANGHGCGDA
jgi:hypothetical protein